MGLKPLRDSGARQGAEESGITETRERGRMC